jgi:hypothetical protein
MRTIAFILDNIGIEIFLGLSFICIVGIYFFSKTYTKEK